MATMEVEDFMRTDGDSVTVLPCEDGTKPDPECSEVEDLQNSLRQAVHDETVRPKMQCLMMDPSFSMVTMQGEDSGIEWETSASRSASRSATPWASEVGAPPEPHAPLIRPATPGALPAGRIIMVMDEENISRRKRTKEKAPSMKRPPQEASDQGDDVVGRPELVGFSLPNDQEQQKEAENSAGDLEQQVFCLVAEGSEILNIVVPPMLASVDEEESTAMEDNLSYLEESPVIKPSGTTDDNVFDFNDDEPVLTPASARPHADEARPVAPNPYCANLMDPPGAPVTRPQARGATSSVDYFEKFTLIDAQAPGSPAVIKEGQEEQQTEEPEEAKASQHTEEPSAPQSRVDEGGADEGEEDADGALLDDVFYAGTTDPMTPGSSDVEECRTPRSPLKQSGSALFGSQEDILTPIFLPDGPAKIIDPILFEEPKAMAFLYTDLYEEATGSRVQEEDAESQGSEKSFHSRHSDREARGYLEKYVLKDETPAVETTNRDNVQEELDGIRLMSQGSYVFGDLPANPGKPEISSGEDEITDFFRSSGNSSPCDMNPFNESAQEEDAAQAKIRARLEVIKATQQMFPPGKPREKDCSDNRAQQTQSSESYEFASEDADWSGMPEDDLASTLSDEPETEHSEDMPVVPPRRKAVSAPKTSLDLTPLRPVAGPDGGHEAGVKEQRAEDKETASPVETADEGDGESEDSSRPPCVPTADTSQAAGTVTEGGDGAGLVRSSTEDKLTEISSPDSANIDLKSDQRGIDVTESTGEDDSVCPPTLVPEPAREKGRCIIL